MPESAPSSPGPSDGESVEIDLRDEDLVDMPTAPMPTIEIEAALPPARRAPTSRPAPPPVQDPPSAADLIAGLVRDTRLIPAPQPSTPPQAAPQQAAPQQAGPQQAGPQPAGPQPAEPLTPPPPQQQQQQHTHRRRSTRRPWPWRSRPSPTPSREPSAVP